MKDRYHQPDVIAVVALIIRAIAAPMFTRPLYVLGQHLAHHRKSIIVMTRRRAKDQVAIGVRHLLLPAVIVKHQLVLHARRRKNHIVMIRQAAVGLVGNGVRLRPVEVGGVAIRAPHVRQRKSTTAIRTLSVRQQVDTGIIIIAVLVLRQNVNPQRSGIVMTRQAAVAREVSGAGHIVRRLVQHARHHQPGTAMTRRRARVLGGIGVLQRQALVVGANQDPVLHQATVETKPARLAKRLQAVQSIAELVQVLAGTRYVPGLRLPQLARAIVEPAQLKHVETVFVEAGKHHHARLTARRVPRGLYLHPDAIAVQVLPLMVDIAAKAYFNTLHVELHQDIVAIKYVVEVRLL